MIYYYYHLGFHMWRQRFTILLTEAYISTNGAMTLETTYMRKVSHHWLAGFGSDDT